MGGVLRAPVFRSNTLTELDWAISPGIGLGGVPVVTQICDIPLAVRTGPSPAQTSVLLPFSMTITPFGPETEFRAGNEQAPANGNSADLSSLVTRLDFVSTMTTSPKTLPGKAPALPTTLEAASA